MIIKINIKGKDRELTGHTQPRNCWILIWAKDRKELNISSGLTLDEWENKQKYFEAKRETR